jgi:hypothetical protein
MKRIIVKTAAIMLILAGVIACGKEKEKEPIDIPFTEYSFGETFCRWIDLDVKEKAILIVINSHAEMEEYVTCEEEDYYPDIDFSENTLLLVTGWSGAWIEFSISFLKNATNQYTLKVEIHSRSLIPAIIKWNRSILTNKIADNAIIALDVNETYD